ncbi:HsdM family class I SAM-dependent methyltransferase [Clostridium sp. ZS2-4]|uniref:HsdM family class I SAM-dependent methyltransferase n=1 Tax=Clostridium sp. ZS2-4 TaxID=2987703 RepID=UPI00227B5EBB|nr:N-6 DNA methylase [Clostridium sp. ZS2-4]MCY6353668.1 N-6 DNA methylase [Clostridium sp. ZS2-4]
MRELCNRLSKFKIAEIESEIIKLFLVQNNIDVMNVRNNFIKNLISNYNNEEIRDLLSEYQDMWQLKHIDNLFEGLIESANKKQNGAVFTPRYIAEYIINNTVENFTRNSKILDPACGSGAFLYVLAEKLNDQHEISIVEAIENNIYGIDIDENHVRRTKIILSLLALKSGEDRDVINFNIIHSDSLRNNWKDLFELESFDYIIGNPPYVNTHDMSGEVKKYLKENFITTTKGVYNIFYAFIEQSMKYLSEEGTLGFIVPNNFITIDAAGELRTFLTSNSYIYKLIDFNLNLAFNPVKTYNAIVFLNKKHNNSIKFSILDRNDNIEEELLNTNFNEINYADLDQKRWCLLTERDIENIRRIENGYRNIRNNIRTGIATLKDKLYMINTAEEDQEYYYTFYNGQRYPIERSIIKKIVKVSDMQNDEEVANCRTKIIFPYEKGENGFQIIAEDSLRDEYPRCYEYLTEIREELDTRDKGKPNSVAWYAYGRSQGLNKYGEKLLFSTFNNRPRFMQDNDDTSLFCNGYALFLDEYEDMHVLKKILNSRIMEYYIDKTSYSIEGGYKCYQKKYVERFSIPHLTEEEIDYLTNENNTDRINEFLIQKYDIDIEI